MKKYLIAFAAALVLLAAAYFLFFGAGAGSQAAPLDVNASAVANASANATQNKSDAGAVAMVKPPAVGFFGGPNVAFVGEEAKFVANAAALQGDYLLLTVSFGDGKVESRTISGAGTAMPSITFSHSYNFPSRYLVVLTATDSLGLKTSANATIFVYSKPAQ